MQIRSCDCCYACVQLLVCLWDFNKQCLFFILFPNVHQSVPDLFLDEFVDRTAGKSRCDNGQGPSPVTSHAYDIHACVCTFLRVCTCFVCECVCVCACTPTCIRVRLRLLLLSCTSFLAFHGTVARIHARSFALTYSRVHTGAGVIGELVGTCAADRIICLSVSPWSALMSVYPNVYMQNTL